MENPLPGSGNYGRAWFAGWLDGLADRLDGGDRAARAYPLLLTMTGPIASERAPRG